MSPAERYLKRNYERLKRNYTLFLAMYERNQQITNKSTCEIKEVI